MPGFLTPLQLEFLGGGKWKLLKAFEYSLREIDSGEWVTVPEGFVTDFASIPRGLWNLLPPTGNYGKAAVIHDYLYQERIIWLQISPRYESYRTCNRAEADSVLLEAMKVLQVGRLTRWAVYAGVRTGGWLAWNRHRKNEIFP